MNKNKVTRVFFIANNVSSGGGSAVLLAQVVNGLAKDKRYHIGVMEITHWNIKPEVFHKDVEIFPPYTYLDSPDRKEKMYSVYHEWDKVIERYIPNDFDIYIAFNYLKPSFLLPKGKKNIVWMHGDIYDLVNKYNNTKDMSEERELLRVALRKIDTIVAINEFTAKSIEDVYPEYKDKIHIINNCIDRDRVKELSKERTVIKLKKPAIISVGRLDENKNPLRLLEIFKRVYKKDNAVRLYYLGCGDLENELFKEIYLCGLQESVSILGFHENPFPIICQADVMGMFSESEGSPLAILEGLSLGIPFVASPVGFMELASNKQTCGKVVDDNDKAADFLLFYIYMDRYTKENLCDASVRRFSFDNYLDEIKQLIKSR